MSKFNKLAKDPKRAEFVSAFTKRVNPVVLSYAATGEGKTHLAQELINHQLTDGSRPYAPVLYIEADEGEETIGEYAHNTDLCKLWSYDGRYGGKLPWFYEKLAAAESEPCGAIVIEGFTALFAEMLAPYLRALTDVKAELWTAHNVPSQHMKNVFQSVKSLKLNRRSAGLGVPVYGTFNVRRVTKDPANSKAGKMDVPDLSDNCTLAAMRVSDAFIELTRGPSGTRMLCQRDPYNKYRKLRGELTAKSVERALDLTLPGLFYAWAIDSARAAKKLSKELQAEYAAASASDGQQAAEAQAAELAATEAAANQATKEAE